MDNIIVIAIIALGGLGLIAALILYFIANKFKVFEDPKIDDILTYAADYGFTQLEEINVDDRGRVEVEGWLDDEWYADVDFSMDNGDTLQEERKRLIIGAWGMSEDDVRQALNAASQEGMTEFESIDIDKSGIIDVEGREQNGRELELSLRQGSFEVTQMDRD